MSWKYWLIWMNSFDDELYLLQFINIAHEIIILEAVLVLAKDTTKGFKSFGTKKVRDKGQFFTVEGIYVAAKPNKELIRSKTTWPNVKE